MNSAEQTVLDLVNKLNASTFGGWFQPSSVMAFVQVESAFRPHAYRKEPSGVASYGLMQILDVTAKGIGFAGKMEDLYDPETGLLWGMKYARLIWDQLARHFGRPPTLTEWCSAYNEGPGNVFKGRDDSAYARPWLAAKEHWRYVDAPVAAAAIPSATEMQRALNAAGADLAVTGVWGVRSQAALAAYYARAGGA